MAGRLVDVGAAGDPAGYRADETRVTTHEAADVVAVAAIPLCPAEAGEVADLVEAGRVPRLGDDLDVGKLLRELNVPQHRRILHR